MATFCRWPWRREPTAVSAHTVPLSRSCFFFPRRIAITQSPSSPVPQAPSTHGGSMNSITKEWTKYETNTNTTHSPSPPLAPNPDQRPLSCPVLGRGSVAVHVVLSSLLAAALLAPGHKLSLVHYKMRLRHSDFQVRLKNRLVWQCDVVAPLPR